MTESDSRGVDRIVARSSSARPRAIGSSAN